MEFSEKLARVAELSRQAASVPEAETLRDLVVKTARQVFSCRSAALVLVSEDSEQLSVGAASGLSETFVRDFRRPVGTGTLAEVMWAGTNLLYDRLDPDGAEFLELRLEHHPVSLMGVRLEVDSRPVGLLLCESDAAAVFTEDDLQLLKVIAAVTAVALDRAALRNVSRKLIMMDPLTQVYSYAYFHRRLTEEVARAQRLNECLAVLLIEIDNLKDFREANGWQATEQTLRDLVKRVAGGVRNIDVVGRYGMDEIILYLPETPRDKATLAAERIRTLIETASKETASSGHTVSIGLASLPENGDTVNRLLEAVTTALLTAQRAGRNRVEAAAPGTAR
ncbi:MAG TPA: diguanylate cyclase [Planctomycetota bacterium]|nr:diguanylate cyclase [Planctomycetota bacterium]